MLVRLRCNLECLHVVDFELVVGCVRLFSLLRGAKERRGYLLRMVLGNDLLRLGRDYLLLLRP